MSDLNDAIQRFIFTVEDGKTPEEIYDAWREIDIQDVCDLVNSDELNSELVLEAQRCTREDTKEESLDFLYGLYCGYSRETDNYTGRALTVLNAIAKIVHAALYSNFMVDSDCADRVDLIRVLEDDDKTLSNIDLYYRYLVEDYVFILSEDSSAVRDLALLHKNATASQRDRLLEIYEGNTRYVDGYGEIPFPKEGGDDDASEEESFSKAIQSTPAASIDSLPRNKLLINLIMARVHRSADVEGQSDIESVRDTSHYCLEPLINDIVRLSFAEDSRTVWVWVRYLGESKGTVVNCGDSTLDIGEEVEFEHEEISDIIFHERISAYEFLKSALARLDLEASEEEQDTIFQNMSARERQAIYKFS